MMHRDDATRAIRSAWYLHLTIELRPALGAEAMFAGDTG